jgi:hypothetical protein
VRQQLVNALDQRCQQHGISQAAVDATNQNTGNALERQLRRVFSPADQPGEDVAGNQPRIAAEVA